MELLERDEALTALARACDAAALGEGRVVFVTGEPGIGKTSLISRFVRDRDAARVLLGTCDDLSIPRPLGPLREALAVDADTHEMHELLISELARRPHPAVLVLEDVHWADAATLDSITFLARRIGSLPAVLVVTYRGGEAPPGHPLHAAVGAARDAVFLELAPLSERAVAELAGEGADGVYRATGGNPFYVTELLAARTADELPPSIANAVLGRASRLDDDARRLVELVSVVPNRVRTSVLDAVMPGWPAAAEEPERRQLLEVDAAHVRFRHELARHAIVSRVPVVTRRGLHAEILAALLEQGADPADIVHHAEAAGAVDVVAEYALVAARRAAAVDSTREAFSHYRRAADFAERLPASEQATLFEELARDRLRRRGDRRRVPGHRARDRDLRRARRHRRRGPLHAGSSRGCTGTPATELPRAAPRSRRRSSSSRSASRPSSPAPTASCPSSPCSRSIPSDRSPGASGRSRWPSASATSRPARTRWSTSARRGCSTTTATTWRCSTRTPSPTPRATATRRRARWATSPSR